MRVTLSGADVEPAKLKNRHRKDLEQSLNQAFGIDFQNALDDFFGVPSNGECGHLVQPQRGRQRTHVGPAVENSGHQDSLE